MKQTELTTAIAANQAAFGLFLDDEQIARLDEFYMLIMEQNALLHLVGPCSAEEFAIRHILESLLLLNYLPETATFADVGTGAGLPSIPCLVVRPGLKAILIESKEKKTAFLTSAINKLGLEERVSVINKQFAELPWPDVSHVTSRALDRFSQHLPRLFKWSGRATRILFGGPNLGDALNGQKISFERDLIPMSQQRFIYHIK